jgi:hypothetical protein
MRPAARLACALLIALAGTVGCGREDGAAAPTPLVDLDPTPASPTAAAVAAYRAWLDALAARDAAAACARHAPQLTIDLRLEAILLDRAELGDPCTAFVAVLWEQPDREYDPIGIEATQLTEEDALLAVDLPVRDQTVTMVHQNARWLVASSVPRTDPADPGDPGDAPTAAAPRRWLDAWCDLELQMSPAELTARMGEPSGTYTVADGGEPQLYWTRDQYDFRAYLDADPPAGRTIDLVGDYDRLTASERADLTCAELR